MHAYIDPFFNHPNVCKSASMPVLSVVCDSTTSSNSLDLIKDGLISQTLHGTGIMNHLPISWVNVGECSIIFHFSSATFFSFFSWLLIPALPYGPPECPTTMHKLTSIHSHMLPSHGQLALFLGAPCRSVGQQWSCGAIHFWSIFKWLFSQKGHQFGGTPRCSKYHVCMRPSRQ